MFSLTVPGTRLTVPGTRLTVPGTRLTVRLRKRQAAARKPRLPAGRTAGRSGLGSHRNIDTLVKQNYWLQILQHKNQPCQCYF